MIKVGILEGGYFHLILNVVWVAWDGQICVVIIMLSVTADIFHLKLLFRAILSLTVDQPLDSIRIILKQKIM